MYTLGVLRRLLISGLYYIYLQKPPSYYSLFYSTIARSLFRIDLNPSSVLTVDQEGGAERKPAAIYILRQRDSCCASIRPAVSERGTDTEQFGAKCRFNAELRIVLNSHVLFPYFCANYACGKRDRSFVRERRILVIAVIIVVIES